MASSRFFYHLLILILDKRELKNLPPEKRLTIHYDDFSQLIIKQNVSVYNSLIGRISDVPMIKMFLFKVSVKS